MAPHKVIKIEDSDDGEGDGMGHGVPTCIYNFSASENKVSGSFGKVVGGVGLVWREGGLGGKRGVPCCREYVHSPHGEWWSNSKVLYRSSGISRLATCHCDSDMAARVWAHAFKG